MAEGKPPKYKRRPIKAGKLAPFEPYLKQRIQAAAPHWISATVLWREVREHVFTGNERLVRNFARSLKPAKKEGPLVRFETAAGLQMQVDWIEFNLRQHSVARLRYQQSENSPTEKCNRGRPKSQSGPRCIQACQAARITFLRLLNPTPARPIPSNASDAGSGTKAISPRPTRSPPAPGLPGL